MEEASQLSWFFLIPWFYISVRIMVQMILDLMEAVLDEIRKLY